MVRTSLKGFQRQLLNGLDALLLHFLHFPRKHCLRSRRAIDTIRLDRHDDPASNLKIQMCVQSDNTRLIWLRYVCEDDIHHGNQHTVAKWVTRVFDDGDDVCAVGSHVDEIATRAVGEFDCEDGSFRANDIGDVRY